MSTKSKNLLSGGPPPYGTISISLDFSRNSLNNTRITGSGFEFEVITPEITHPGELRVTSVYSCAKSKERHVLIGKIEWNLDGFTPPLATVYSSASGQISFAVFESSQTIISKQGERYRWNIHPDHLAMYNLSAKVPNTEAIATFHRAKRNAFGKQTHPARIELSSVAIPSLNKLILSLLVMERSRTDLAHEELGQLLRRKFRE